MCLIVYLVTDANPPEIKREKTRPNFQAGRLRRKEEFLRDVPGANAYALGSWQGCGCGFISDDDASKASRDELSEYVASALGNDTRLWLFAAWAGDEWKQAALAKVRAADLALYPWEQTWDRPHLIEVINETG